MVRTHRGFTLVELLVVITIIVVLLAMLVPAMDKAIYQAELAVCGTRQHAIAAGALSYTVAHARRYPHRPALRQSTSARAIDLYSGNYTLGGLNPVEDERLILREFLSLNGHLNCPLTKAIDIEGSDADTGITSPYALYFGFHYRAGLPEKGMLRMGDRFTWTTRGDGTAPPIVDSFNVLASDWDGTYTEGLHIATHPDTKGVMSPWVYQDQDWIGAVPGGMGPTKVTASFWHSPESARTIKRGTIDTNYAYDDGSVARFDRVESDEGDPTNTNSAGRMVWAPQRGDGYNTNPTWQLNLPKR